MRNNTSYLVSQHFRHYHRIIKVIKYVKKEQIAGIIQ